MGKIYSGEFRCLEIFLRCPEGEDGRLRLRQEGQDWMEYPAGRCQYRLRRIPLDAHPYVDYDDGFNVRKENALALIGSYQYQVYSAELGDDLIAIPIPDFGGGVYTCSGSGVYFMTTAATQRGVGDLAYKVMEMLMTPEFVSKITDANGCIPGLKSVLEYKEGYQPGETFYLFREQLEAGISYLRPRTPAHMTNYSAVAEALSNIFLGADPATELHKAAESVDAVILENGWDQWID